MTRGSGKDHIVYGVQPVIEALAGDAAVSRVYLARDAGGKTRRIADLAGQAGAKVTRLDRKDLDRRCGTDNHQGVAAELDRSSVITVEVEQILDRAEAAGEPPLLLLLDGIQDPQNLGAILRSAFALGVHGAVIPLKRAAQVTPAVVRASAGAALHVPVARVTNLKQTVALLKERGVWTAAAVMDGSPAHTARLDGGMALVIGNEAKGVRPTLAEACDHRITVPLAGGFDSLNASVAAGILLYEVVRQRLDKAKRRA